MIINNDIMEVDLSSYNFDIILTDPPFGTGREREVNRKRNYLKYNNEFKDKNNNLWDFIEGDEFFEWTWRWVDKCIEQLRPGGYFISFFDRDKINFLSYYLQNKGFKLRNYICDCLVNPVPRAGLVV